jgi:hypothetical protein
LSNVEFVAHSQKTPVENVAIYHWGSDAEFGFLDLTRQRIGGSLKFQCQNVRTTRADRMITDSTPRSALAGEIRRKIVSDRPPIRHRSRNRKSKTGGVDSKHMATFVPKITVLTHSHLSLAPVELFYPAILAKIGRFSDRIRQRRRIGEKELLPHRVQPRIHHMAKTACRYLPYSSR